MVYSGSDVAGEGEHKIFDYIRRMRGQKGFQDSDTHCVYGNDADLIMLSLCSHLKNIVILRETFQFRKKVTIAAKRFKDPVAYEFVNIGVLRDCLEIEFREVRKKMEKNRFSLKSVIDDFVFVCFFVGNDFLPKMFCFDIRKGYLDRLIEMFKQFLCEANEFLIVNNRINFRAFEGFIRKLAKWELELIGEK